MVSRQLPVHHIALFDPVKFSVFLDTCVLVYECWGVGGWVQICASASGLSGCTYV